MLQKRILSISSFALLVLSLGCAHTHQAKEEVVHTVNQAAAAPTVQAVAPGADYAVVKFEKGSHALSQSGREELNRISQMAAKQGRTIGDIKILAWSDREYPISGAKATRRDVSLANDRAEVIKTYIKDDLHTHVSVDKHNMAKRPGFFSELIKTDDYKLKENLQQAGAESTSEKLFAGSKESKAIVLIKYQ